MTPLEQQVFDALVRTNHPIGPNDPPYPASLMPIVREVVAVIEDHIARFRACTCKGNDRFPATHATNCPRFGGAS